MAVHQAVPQAYSNLQREVEEDIFVSRDGDRWAGVSLALGGASSFELTISPYLEEGDDPILPGQVNVYVFTARRPIDPATATPGNVARQQTLDFFVMPPTIGSVSPGPYYGGPSTNRYVAAGAYAVVLLNMADDPEINRSLRARVNLRVVS